MSEQLSLFDSGDASPKSVSEITRYIRGLFDLDAQLQDVWVEGEVSNYKRAASGHMYFSLKDDDAQLKCVMWKTAAERLNFEPGHGDQVLASGKIGVYETQGVYQLYVETLQPAGIGDLNRQFEILKARMDAEGLFDADRKRALPALPRRIGIVTSPDAAGFRDVLNILERRYPVAHVILSKTSVQGNQAPPQIVAAIERLNRRNDIDVMLIVRGGGSLEDLWCFNDESVVRAVANSGIPTVTGVGHEIDFTLVDFAADVRAPTPSAAAEIATPDRQDLLVALQDYSQHLNAHLTGRLSELRGQLNGFERTLRLLTPANKTANLRQHLDDQSARMAAALRADLRHERQRIDALADRLHSANPQTIMARGYAMLRREGDGKRLTSVQDAAPGTSIVVRMQDGELAARVKERTES
jgi:exodeoxyribonuclease VII large subunit